MANSKNIPEYGFDGPEFIRGFFIGGGLLFLAGCAGLGLGTSMLAYGLRGKFNVRERMLSLINWRGDETVLDVGTGRGLLAIGAAKRLTTGKVIGIDIWRAEDLTDNSPNNTLANARLEGVSNKLDLRTEDASRMSFANDTFDVVLSLLCLHNIEEDAEREAACHEIARVLKPGGTAVIGDYIKTSEYVKVLTRAGLTIQSHVSSVREAYGPMRLIVATKPVA